MLIANSKSNWLKPSKGGENNFTVNNYPLSILKEGVFLALKASILALNL